MGKYIFTDEQIEYIVDNWDKESIHSMKNRFGCTWYAVAKIGEIYGLDLPTSNYWSDEEIETLKTLSEDYHYEEIAKIMNRTENAIYLKAKRLKIDLIMDRKSWTDEDEAYLYERWGRDNIEKIAKDMKRSFYAIKVKATRMGLGYMHDANIDQIKVADISEILNVRAERITDTWLKYGLKLKRKKVSANHGYYCIKISDLLEFLKNNQDLWNSQYLEKNILGKEPDWLLEKRKKDIIDPPQEYTRWTEEELSLTKELILKGFDYDYISSYVNHTPNAIAYKARALGLSYRLKKYWKGSEIKLLKENYPAMSAKELSEILERSPKNIQGKAAELGIKKRLSREDDKNKKL